jgi:hypothetical protein
LEIQSGQLSMEDILAKFLRRFRHSIIYHWATLWGKWHFKVQCPRNGTITISPDPGLLLHLQTRAPVKVPENYQQVLPTTTSLSETLFSISRTSFILEITLFFLTYLRFHSYSINRLSFIPQWQITDS